MQMHKREVQENGKVRYLRQGVTFGIQILSLTVVPTELGSRTFVV